MAISPEVLHQYLTKDLVAQGLDETKTWATMTPKQMFAVSLRASLTKKLVTAVSPLADTRALAKFLQCNRACGDWDYTDRWKTVDCKTEILLGELKRVIDDFWHRRGMPLVDHPYELLNRGRVGPGTSRYSRGNSFYAKLFSSPLTCSDPSLYSWYKRYTQRFAEWSNAENTRSMTYGGPSVTSSKLSFVPKNDEISRTICVEPSLNTFFQLGLADVLEERLKYQFGIDLSDQQFKNRDLARLGSITNGISTIDLSSASDSISMKMLSWLLPASFYKMLVWLRTPSVDVDGVGTVPLNMISTMGNGYTFPLQTIIFAGVVIACLRFRFGRSFDPRRQDTSETLWGVNGDDIACPSLITGDVITLLTFLGFSVNGDKSFTEGPFRESCGSDFFNGVDVRGVYLKDTSSHASLYSAINLLVRFSVRSGIQLRNLIGLLQSKVKTRFVPRWEDLSAGIHSPSYLPQVRRYRRDIDLQAKAYQAYVSRGRYVHVRSDFIDTPRGHKRLTYNTSGVMISLLQGSINNGSWTDREVTPRYHWKRRCTSRWDALPPSIRDHFDYGMDWQRWEIVAYLLFSDQ
jgi:hypothetical protein